MGKGRKIHLLSRWAALALFVQGSAAHAFIAQELPALDLFGAEERITQRTQKLTPDSCPEIPTEEKALTLMEVINAVLCHNPDTRASWFSLRATAASQNATQINERLPSLSSSASLSRSGTQSNSSYSISEGSSASISLGYTLFDFGRREASLEAAEQSFRASILGYDSALQGTIATALQSYYQVLSAKGSVEVSRESLRFAKESLEAAKLRYELGLVPRSDILQAEASYSQSELSTQQTENAYALAKGALATLMGLKPQTPLTIAEIDDSQLVSDSFTMELQKLQEVAKTYRVDLAISEASLRGARASLEAQRRSDLPRIALSASQSFSDIDVFNTSTRRSGSIGLSVSIPIFSGLTQPYSLRASEDQLKAQELGLERTKLGIMQDVWRTYTNYQTSEQSWMVSWEFVASATELRDITLARYKEGIGTILDVLSAQNQYNSALQRQIDARYNLLVTRADLMRSIGILNLETVTPGATPAALKGAKNEE